MTTYYYLIVLYLAITNGLPYQEDNTPFDHGEEENEVVEIASSHTPNFVSTSKSILVNEGETVRLPCIVDRLDGFVILWKKDGEIITVSDQIIDNRVRLDIEKTGNYLVIGQASPEEEGTYTCQISAFKPTELTHTVKIRKEPVIEINPNGVIQINNGEHVTFTCSVIQGSPIPKIKWKRLGSALPNGEDEHVKNNLTFESVTRHHAGHYVCEADNGYALEPVTEGIQLVVNYPPEIGKEETEFKTSHGESQELVCNILAMPAANVTWTKDDIVITTKTPNVLLNQVDHRYSLTLLSITKEMLGNYQCKAENDLGVNTVKYVVSGLAAPVVITSSSESPDKNHHILKWNVESPSPVSKFKVWVQNVEGSDWKVHEVQIISTQNIEEKNTYISELKLVDLLPGRKYKAKLATSNSFGFNEPGDIFTFQTKEEDPVFQPSTLTSKGFHPDYRLDILALISISSMLLI